MENNIFEIEKSILKCQSPEEIDSIAQELTHQQLRDVLKLVIYRLTPTNIKINRELNDFEI